MKRDLWLRLREYQFENLVPPHLLDRVAAVFGSTDASTHAFSNKLARKLGWTQPFARGAIEEYRKFVYLGVTAEFSVTPPRVIDQVWHEHLLFSKAYREFCRDVLQQDFDHHPELVPSDEQVAQYQRQYDDTLALYETEFNVAPPAAFWGTPKFAHRDRRTPLSTRRVDAVADGVDPMPLYTYFSGSDASDAGGSAFGEFGGGGGFSGGGGGSDWGDGASGADGDASGGGGDSSGGDSGGGDSGGGSSCSSGGCSSSCGGGGCSS